jgi:hypothetical protein
MSRREVSKLGWYSEWRVPFNKRWVEQGRYRDEETDEWYVLEVNIVSQKKRARKVSDD